MRAKSLTRRRKKELGSFMGADNRHFIGYHNTEKMGRPLEPATASRVLTNKSTKRFEGHLIWMIAGEGSKPRKYSLCSLFRVTETGDTGDDSLRHFAQGQGTCFDPPIALTSLDWFDDLRKAMNSFQFGVSELKEEKLIEKLVTIANVEALP